MTTTVRTLSCSVTFAGNSLTDVIQARGQVSADTGWPSCSVFVTAKPTTGNEDDDISVVAGAGNNTTRFTGVLRQFRTSAFPKSLELVCTGTLAYADDWAPESDMAWDPDIPGWTDDWVPRELPAMFGATDQQLIRGVLDLVPNISYSSGDIGGRGVELGTFAPDAFIWKAGTSAWRYIQRLDQATLYRTYQDRSGVIRRVHMVGHPSGSPSFTLGDNDVLDSATGGRDTLRTRSGVVVTGYDPGDGAGPIQAQREGSFRDWETRWTTFGNNLIESSADEGDDNGGLDAGDIADEVLADTLKEFVDATVPTWRDDTCEPGQTILLDCLNRLAIGENMWVQAYAWEVTDNFTATFTLSGGGV